MVLGGPLIEVDGNNLVLSACVITLLDVGVTPSSGQTVKFSLLKRSTLKFWNVLTGEFDLDDEPTLISLVHVANGEYEKVLTGAFKPVDDIFRYHILSTGIHTGDFGGSNSLQIKDLLNCCRANTAIAVKNSSEIITLKNDTAKTRNDLRLLIASNERLQKGRL